MKQQASLSPGGPLFLSPQSYVDDSAWHRLAPTSGRDTIRISYSSRPLPHAYITRHSVCCPRFNFFAHPGPCHEVRPVSHFCQNSQLVYRKRRRVLKNNERLAYAVKAGVPTPEDVQDQGFTRPSILILLPFRSSAIRWLESMISHTPPPSFQIENMTRFRKEFGLPEGVVDKFSSAEPDPYPRDHIETFKGNPDDNFRVGLKLTRKSVRLFTEFYGSDIIIASPLGLRMSIEKEKYAFHHRSSTSIVNSDAVRNFDFLSSIEILVADQVDCLTMQNWEHTNVSVVTRGYQILVTSGPLVCLFPPQPIANRVARHRLFPHQALVLGWAVHVPLLAMLL